ncbi:unnamed protein product [Enterobius vermicularis]|uniref:CBFD_NFYB_HMF domain-containing protein n=1 Tax=Enterobius vermicularis TaxID=51028 RepID=A0A0N4VN66_ENTVE|nr:unnamed protein product [Enterobius vermicularis]
MSLPGPSSRSQSDNLSEISEKLLSTATRTQELPLARVKKVMKIDDQVKQQMISTDVPVLMSKACEIFCEHLTLTAWKFTEKGKRKTLTKSDVNLLDTYTHFHSFFFFCFVLQNDKFFKFGVLLMFLQFHRFTSTLV